MLKKLLLFLIFFSLGVALVFAADFMVSNNTIQKLNPAIKSKFSIDNPPFDSLKGKISSLSGTVSFQPRSKDYATLINAPVEILQGEDLNTGGNGSATVIFDRIGEISLSENTQISFIQTLPQNFVISQKQGTATFQKTGNIPFSVRGLDLLINLESGKTSINVDPDNSIITVDVLKGSISAAFNDTDNLSNVITIESPRRYIFNNNTKKGRISYL